MNQAHNTTEFRKESQQFFISRFFVRTVLLFVLTLSMLKCDAGVVNIEQDLRVDQEPSPSLDNDLHIESTIGRSQSNPVDDLDANEENLQHHKHRHHHRHHYRHHHADVNSTEDARLEHNPLAKTQIASELAEMCEQGRITDVNLIKWKNEKCETCHCEGRAVTCEHEFCPNLPCENPVSVEGECCQECPEKLCHEVDGRYFNDGAEWHRDDCTFCECRKGRVLCSVEDCEFKTCANPTKVPGQCCPICPDLSCLEDNGHNYTAGAVWKEGACTHCYCRKGERVCADEKCPHINCTNPYRRPEECCARCPGAIECVVSTWGTWGECPIQECGGGMNRRYRSVVIHPRNGGSFCPHMSEAQMCPRLPCNEIPVCPVTSWSSWSLCTATCGTGRRMRLRQKAKVTKTTMTSLIDCSETHFQESTECYAGSCSVSAKMLAHTESDLDHCLEMRWTDWGQCSVDCGAGVQTRNQELINSSHPLGHLCHLLQEMKQCQGEACNASKNSPVHCKVSHWGPWTPCSHSCGTEAVKSKHRTVIRHASVGGRPCPRLQISKPCKLEPCSLSTQYEMDTDHRCVSNNGKIRYAENERWNPSECTSCQCVNSRKTCQPIFCPTPECDFPTKFDGFCCSFCLGE